MDKSDSESRKGSSKALLRNAELAHIFHHQAKQFGIPGDVSFDDGAVYDRSRQDADGRVKGVHFFASEELEAGESVVSLARWLGHSDPGFTLRKYSHFLPRAGARGSAAIDAISRSCGRCRSVEPVERGS